MGADHLGGFEVDFGWCELRDFGEILSGGREAGYAIIWGMARDLGDEKWKRSLGEGGFGAREDLAEQSDAAKSLSEAEKAADGGFGASGDDETSQERAQDGESGQGFKFTGGVGKKAAKKKGGLKALLPSGGIIGLLFAALIGGAGIMGPVLQITHIVEMITGRYDMAGFTAMRRTSNVMMKKLGTVNVGGTAVVRMPTVGGHAYFGRMNARTADRFRNAGFELIDGSGVPITGAPRSGQLHQLKRTGGTQTWNAQQFARDYHNIPAFRGDINRVYRGRVGNWFDTKARNMRMRFNLRNAGGTNLANAARGDPQAVRLQKNFQMARNYANSVGSSTIDLFAITNDAGDILYYVDGGGNHFTFEDGQALLNMNDGAARVAGELQQAISDATVAGINRFVRNVGRALNVLGAAQAICELVNMFNLVRQGIQILQVDQMMNAAHLFLADADSIKFGDADPLVVAEIGARLNEPVSYTTINPDLVPEVADNDNDATNALLNMTFLSDDSPDPPYYMPSRPQTASEAQSFRWMAYNDQIPHLDGSASRFVGGASGILGALLQFFNARWVHTLCGVVTHPVVYGATMIGSIALMVFTLGGGAAGVNATISTAMAAGKRVALKQLGTRMARNLGSTLIATITTGRGLLSLGLVALPFALRFLAPTIVRMAAGTVCKDVWGQDYMNCIASGAGALHSRMGASGGNVALSKDDAAAMYQDFRLYTAQVAEDERLVRSPFDITSQHTFLGNLVGRFAPLLTIRMSTQAPVNVMSAIGTIARESAVDVQPQASAFIFSLANFRASMEICDEAQAEGWMEGLATDPFCNVIYGVPVAQLNGVNAADNLNQFVAEFQLRVLNEDSDLPTLDIYQNFWGTWVYTPWGRVCDGGQRRWRTDAVGNVDPLACDTGTPTPLTRYRRLCMERGIDAPMRGDNTPIPPPHLGGIYALHIPSGIRDRRWCITGERGLNHNHAGILIDNAYRARMALFYIDTRIEENMNGTSLNRADWDEMDRRDEVMIARRDAHNEAAVGWLRDSLRQIGAGWMRGMPVMRMGL